MSGSGLHSPAKINKGGQIQLQPTKNQIFYNEENNNDGFNSELLEVIADLVLKHKIAENRLSLRIKEATKCRLLVEDLSSAFCFEVWWHENEREAIRETMMHRILREHPLPNLLTALDFKFKDRKYLLRQKNASEISLAEYIRAPNKPFILQLEHIINGIKALHDLQSRSQNANITKTRRVTVSTVYSADHTMILPNKEGGFEFKYQATSDINLMALYSRDNIGEILYSSDAKEPLWSSYPVYASLAEVAEQIGADPSLVKRISCKGTHDSGTPLPINDILEQNSSVYVCERTSQPAEPVINETLLLERLATLLLQHGVVQTRPVLVIQDRTSWGHIVVDKNDNLFEVYWLRAIGRKKEDGLKELAMHNLIRNANLQHFITAEFGFELDGSFALVMRHARTDIPLCSSIYKHEDTTYSRFSGIYTKNLSLKEVLKLVGQLGEFFKRLLVHIEQLSVERPLSVTAKQFSGQDLWLIPDGRGGYDFKFQVNPAYQVMKLADDGVGIIVYCFECVEDPDFGVFATLAGIADDLGFEDLYELICDLDPRQADFNENLAAVMQFGDQFGLELP